MNGWRSRFLKADEEFAAHMEQVFDSYPRPYDTICIAQWCA